MQKTNILLTQCALFMVRNQLSPTPQKMSFVRVPAQVGPQNTPITYSYAMSGRGQIQKALPKYSNYLHVYEMINKNILILVLSHFIQSTPFNLET